MILVDETNRLWRGPKPINLAQLGSRGIKRIVSFETGFYDLFHEERQFPCEYGIEQYDLHCSNITPPEDWAVRKFLKLTLDAKPTYVHCLSGVDRTGFMCAAYRMQINRWTFEAAVAEWVSLGRHPWYFWWEMKLQKWSVRERN